MASVTLQELWAQYAQRRARYTQRQTERGNPVYSRLLMPQRAAPRPKIRIYQNIDQLPDRNLQEAYRKTRTLGYYPTTVVKNVPPPGKALRTVEGVYMSPKMFETGGWRPGTQILRMPEGQNQVEDVAILPKGEGYWENPYRVARYHNFLSARPPGYQPPDWLNVEQVEQAYQYLKYRNDDKPWTEWKRLPEDDPGTQFFKQIQSPPDEFLLRDEKEPLAPEYPEEMPGGLQLETGWPTLSKTEQTLLSFLIPEEGMEDRPEWSRVTAALGRGALAAPVGAAVGSMILPGWGTAIGAGLVGLGTAYSAYTGQEIPGISQTLWVLDQAAIAAMQAWGMADLIQANGLDRIMANMPEAYEASKLKYITKEAEVANIIGPGISAFWDLIYELGLGQVPGGWEPMTEQQVLQIQKGIHGPQELRGGVRGVAAMDEAFERMVMNDEDPIEVYLDYVDRFGFSGTLNDFVMQSLIDPLVFAPGLEGYVGKRVAKAVGAQRMAYAFDLTKGNLMIDLLPPGIQQIVSAVTKQPGSGGLFGALSTYKHMIRTGTFPAGMAIKAPDQLSWFERNFAGLTNEGYWRDITPASTQGGLFKWASYLTQLDPVAKAHVFLDNLMDNLKVVLHLSKDPDMSISMLEKAARVRPVEAGDVGEAVLKAPLTATVSQAYKDVINSRVAKELLIEYHSGDAARPLIAKIARALGTSEAEVIRMARENLGALAARVEGVAPGLGKAKYIETLLKPFTGDNAIPLNLAEFHAKLINTLTVGIGDWMVARFGIKQGPALVRLTRALKTAQSILLLNLSPTYFLNNTINNVATRAVVGVFGFMTPTQIRKWLDRFGITPERLAEGIGATGDVDARLTGPLRDAYMGRDAIALAQRIVSAVSSKISLFSKASAKVEAAESSQAYMIAMTQFWPKIWKRSKGFRKMPASLEAKLEAFAPGTRDAVYAVIEAGMSPGEIEQALTRDIMRPQVNDILDKVAKKLFPDNPDSARELLDTTGIREMLEDRLSRVENPEEARAVFKAAEQMLREFVDEQISQELVTRAEDVRNIILKEGYLSALAIFTDLEVYLANHWLDHWEEMEEIFGRGRPTVQGADYEEGVRLSMDANGREWDRVNSYENQTIAGILRGLGMQSEHARQFSLIMTRMHEGWHKFFALRNQKNAEYFRMKRNKGESYEDFWARKNETWERNSLELETEYRNMSDLENELQVQMTEILARAFEEQTGRAGEALRAWRQQVLDMRRSMQTAVNEFRDSIKGLSPEARREAWTGFKQRYTRMVVELKEIEITGANELARQPTSADTIQQMREQLVARGRPADEAAQMSDAEVNAAFAAAESQGAQVPANAKAVLDLARASGIVDKRGRVIPQYALNAINSRSEVQYENLDKVPIEVAQKAFAAHVRKYRYLEAKQKITDIIKARGILKMADDDARANALHAEGLMSRRMVREEMMALGATPEEAAATLAQIDFHADVMARLARRKPTNATRDAWYATHIGQILVDSEGMGLHQAGVENRWIAEARRYFPTHKKIVHGPQILAGDGTSFLLEDSHADSIEALTKGTVEEEAFFRQTGAARVGMYESIIYAEFFGKPTFEQIQALLNAQKGTKRSLLVSRNDAPVSMEWDTYDPVAVEAWLTDQWGGRLYQGPLSAEDATTLRYETARDNVLRLFGTWDDVNVGLRRLTYGTFTREEWNALDEYRSAKQMYDWQERHGHAFGADLDDFRTLIREQGPPGRVLYQGERGSVNFLEDGRAIIRAMNAPDVSTLVHEVAHIFRRDLEGPDLDAIAQWGGLRNGQELYDLALQFQAGDPLWTEYNDLLRKVAAKTITQSEVTRLYELDQDPLVISFRKYVEAEEKFAKGWERYLAEGDAPTPALQSVFKQFTDWMLRIYQALKRELGIVKGFEQVPEFAGVDIHEVVGGLKIRDILDRMLTLEVQRGGEEAEAAPPRPRAPEPVPVDQAEAYAERMAAEEMAARQADFDAGKPVDFDALPQELRPVPLTQDPPKRIAEAKADIFRDLSGEELAYAEALVAAIEEGVMSLPAERGLSLARAAAIRSRTYRHFNQITLWPRRAALDPGARPGSGLQVSRSYAFRFGDHTIAGFVYRDGEMVAYLPGDPEAFSSFTDSQGKIVRVLGIDPTDSTRYVIESDGRIEGIDPDNAALHQEAAELEDLSRRLRQDENFQKSLAPIGSIDLTDPDVALYDRIQAPWTTIDKIGTDVWSKVNNRMRKELEVVQRLLGPIVSAQDVPVTYQWPGKPRLRKQSIYAADLGNALHAAKADGRLGRLLDDSISPKALADAMGITNDPLINDEGKPIKNKTQRSEYINFVTKLRQNWEDIHSADPKVQASELLLTDNGKAGKSVDFALATCDPSENCQVCYAAGIVYDGVIQKSMRNTILMMMDPAAYGQKLANEVMAFNHVELPFLRLLGSGDMTSTEMIDTFNTIAQNIDRPIMIFSRHYLNLGKLRGTQKAPFIKLGSIDSQLLNTWGMDFVKANMRDRAVNNGFLYVDPSEIPVIQELYKANALGLIFAATPELHRLLPYELRVMSCPCDAGERTFNYSCRQCALSLSGCYMVFASKVVDSNGKVWDIADVPEATGNVLPLISFLDPESTGRVGSFQARVYARNVAQQMEYTKQGIVESLNKYKAGSSNYVLLKDIRWADEKVTLIDRDLYARAENEKRAKKNEVLAAKGKPLLEMVDPADLRHTADTRYLSRGELLASVTAFLERLEAFKQAAMLQGTFYLPGGEIQLPIEYEAWKKVKEPVEPVRTWLKGREEGGILYQPGVEPPQATASQLYHEAQTNSQNFKVWFGMSAAVDPAGKPKILYHGTARAGFEVFAPGRFSAGYFTSNPAYASWFAVRRSMDYGGTSVAVYPVYLSIQKPLDLTSLGARTEVSFSQIYDIMIQGVSPKVIKDVRKIYPLDSYIRDIGRAEVYAWVNSDMVQAMINAAGYDGIQLLEFDPENMNLGDVDAWVAFDGTQIKSLHNSGEYSLLNDNILHQPALEEAPVEGEVPVGGTPSPEPYGQLLGEVTNDAVRPLLRQMQDDFVTGMTQRPLAMDGLDDESQAGLRRYLREVESDMASAKYMTMKYGEQMRDEALLNYHRRYGMDTLLDLVFPYQFWYTRTMWNWAKRMIDRPYWFAMYGRLKAAQEKMEDEGIPTRLKGKIKISAPWLPDWAGTGLYIDPLSKLFPFAQFAQPLEQFMSDKTQIERRAESILQEMVETDLITPSEMREALDNRAGNTWEQALKSAELELGKTDNPANLVSLMMQPAMYWTVPNALMQGKPEKIGTLPMTRMGQALRTATEGTFLEGPGGFLGSALALPEERLRTANQLSQFGEWGDYYIDRQLANMAADGVIDAQTATIAMIQRQGAAYEEAMRRVEYEIMLRSPGASTLRELLQGNFKNAVDTLPNLFFSGGLLPDGELAQRGLKEEYDRAWYSKEKGFDEDAVNQFFEDHPEYEARLALYDEGEERLRQFLISEVWDRYMALDSANRRVAREEFGRTFQDAFLSKETRSYDSIKVETLAVWARALGGALPQVPETQAEEVLGTEPLRLYSPEIASGVQDYQAERAQKYPNYYALQNLYYDIPDSDKKGRRDFLARFPELKEYWEWNRAYKKSHPELDEYWNKQKMTRVISEKDLAQVDEVLLRELYASALLGQELSEGALAELSRLAREYGVSTDEYIKMVLMAIVPIQ